MSADHIPSRFSRALLALLFVVAGGLTGCSRSAGKDTGVGAEPGSVTAGGPRWNPPPGVAWQWQLAGSFDLSVDVPVYDIDWQTPPSVVDQLHKLGRRAICYVSVGTWESFRRDAGAFPEAVRGKTLSGWPDERWLDVRHIDLLKAPLLHRLDQCKKSGFDGVEPDNVDAYMNKSGFDLSAADQLRFNRWVAGEVHARGMSVGLKNDLQQIPDLVDEFDFAVNEQCVEYNECQALQPFLDAGKAVLHAEYNVSLQRMCAAAPAGFSSIRKNLTLDAHREACGS